jgi:hypothetical protein
LLFYLRVCVRMAVARYVRRIGGVGSNRRTSARNSILINRGLDYDDKMEKALHDSEARVVKVTDMLTLLEKRHQSLIREFENLTKSYVETKVREDIIFMYTRATLGCNH